MFLSSSLIKAIVSSLNDTRLILRVLFTLLTAILFKDLDHQTKLIAYYILTIPQIFRRTFQILIDPIKMRQIRIGAGPAAIILQIYILSLNFLSILKCLVIFAGIWLIPKKNQHFQTNKARHGLAMKLLFIITTFQVLWQILYLQINYNFICQFTKPWESSLYSFKPIIQTPLNYF